ncbi:MAG: DUF86 domain-containing protein [Kiritimatiellae bacterium]|nr:DUF86 domain-containing protein [Kiritimatiellia bacterium]
MPHDPKIYLQDMLEAIERIEAYTRGFDIRAVGEDQRTFDAVVRNLEVLGEAAKAVPERVRNQAAEVEWRKLAGLRDILIHQYFGIDTDILEDVIATKLAGLKEPIRKLLASLP